MLSQEIEFCTWCINFTRAAWVS